MLQTPTVPLPVSFTIVATVLILFFIVFFYLFIIQMQRRRSLHLKEMLEMKAQYEKTILQSQLEIQEQTFRNISQEIHDNIGQVLSLAKLNLNTIPHDGAADKISLTEELLGKAINDLRDLSKSLHPEKISDIGLLNAIRHELLVVQKVSRVHTELLADEAEVKVESNKAVIVFRMIQEIIHNTLKHAKAKHIIVQIRQQSNNKTFIQVKDDGTGFDPAKLNSNDTGIGLKSLQQRCKLIDAECIIDSAMGKGTNVQLVINNN